MKNAREMTGKAVARIREREGWTREQLADRVHASPMEVAAWEAGTIAVPAPQARRLRDVVDGWRRDAARTALQPSSCAWARENGPRIRRLFDAPPAPGVVGEDLRAHLASCAECASLHEMADRLGVFGSDPGFGRDSLLRRLQRDLRALPPELSAVAVLFAVAPVISLLSYLLERLPKVALPMPDTEGWTAIAMGFLTMGMFTRLARGKLRRWPYAVTMLASFAGAAVALAGWTAMDGGGFPDARLLMQGAAVAIVAGLVRGWALDPGEDDEGREEGV